MVNEARWFSMTKTFKKNIRRSITGSLGRYLAILLIIMLGVAFLTGLRITRRGRLAMTTTTLAVASIAGAGMAFGGPGADAPEVTVERGQTLSSIAEAEMAGVPTHEAVTQIQVANDLTSSHVHVGQTLTIPTP